MTTDLPGTAPPQISYYRLGNALGQGGMGTVYEATDVRTDRQVALKLVHPHLATDEAYRDRFTREAHVASLLRSPYTVHLLDYGEEDGRYYLVTRLVRGGRTVRDLLSAGSVPRGQALRIAGQIARALEEAASRGVVHRDVKPENILLAADGTALLADFGIARQAGAATLTSAGGFIGTPAYAAPEVMGGQADHRSDIYSLGVTLYHMLTGQPPFEGDPLELLRRHADEPMPREPLVGQPEELVAAVVGCMEKDPAQRYQSATELAGVLEHLAEDAAEEEARDAAPVTMTLERPVEPETQSAASTVTLELGTSSLRGRMVPGRRSARYELVLRNDGDERVELSLAASDDDETCAFSLPEQVTLAPREQTTVSLSVRPRRRRLLGKGIARPFTVTATDRRGGPPMLVSAQFDDRPGEWLPYTGAAFSIAAVGVIFALAALVGGGGAPDAAAPGSESTAGVVGEAESEAAGAASGLVSRGSVGLDRVTADRLEAVETIHVWTFEAAAGQLISVGAVAEESGVQPRLEVRGPDDELLAFGIRSEDEVWIVGWSVPRDGQFTARVGVTAGSAAGGYRLELWNDRGTEWTAVTDAPGRAGEEPLTYRQVHYATLDDGGEGRWRFSGQFDQLVAASVQSLQPGSFDPQLELLMPDGFSLSTAGEADGTGAASIAAAFLPDDGEYSLVVTALGDGGGGLYAVWLELLEDSAPAAAATADGAFSGELIKVLVDELHDDELTADAERADALDPAYPDWHLIAFRSDVETESVADMTLAEVELERYDVLVVTCTDIWPYSEEEVDAVERFVSAGGGLLMIGDQWCNFGLLGRRLAVEADSSFGQVSSTNAEPQSSFWITDLADHEVTAGIFGISVFWPGTLILGAEWDVLATTGAESWRDEDVDEVRDASEPAGPFDYLAVREIGAGRVLAIADYGPFRASTDRSELRDNAIGWLAGR